jgi:protein SCO1/2
MKPKVILSALGVFTLLAVASAVVLVRRSQPAPSVPVGAQVFQVHGQVRGLEAAGKTIRIAHEAIPGYMPAMTMPFHVKDATLLKGLSVGDRVQFELVVTRDDSWIAHVETVSTEASAVAATVTKPAASIPDRETERVQTGEAVPDFQLIDQNGRPFRLSELRGKAVVLTFIYTRCPIPNFCPLMSKNFADLQGRLEKEFSGRYQLVSVSLDPRFDRPEVLKEYASRYGADERHWRFATGDEEQINFVTGLMGLFHEPENGLISHDLRTALIGPDGRLVQLWKSNVWTPYEVQRRVRETLTGAKDVAAR